MTEDYKAGSIADETRRDVERRTQSPYTRAEFIAREVESGIEAQGIPGIDVPDLDPDAMTAIRQRAEWNAQAAERAGITWRQEAAPPAPYKLVDWLADRVDDLEVSHKEQAERIAGLERRENLHVQAIGELSGRMRALEQQVARPIVAEIHDPTGARTAYHAIEERAKDEIRTLIREETDLWKPIQQNLQHRLNLQLERITELDNEVASLRQVADGRQKGLVLRILALESASNVNVMQRVERIESEWKIEGQKLATDRAKLRSFVVDGVGKDLESVRERVEMMWRRLYENVTDAADYGLLEQVQRIADKLDDAHDLATSTWNSLHNKAFRDHDDSPGLLDVVRRLDADMALVRDALCPPQGVVPAVEQQPAPTFKCAGRYCPGLPYPPSERMHPESCVARTPFTFDDWWTHFTSAGIYLGNGINVDRESTTGNALYRYLRQTWNAAQGRASIQAGEGGTAQQDDDDP